MDTIIRRLRESRKPDSRYYKKVEAVLNNQLFGDEESVTVENLEIISETPTKITFQVDYQVTISIPMYDEESDREYEETEEEYRTRTLTLDKADLEESSSLALGPEEMRSELVRSGDYTKEEASKLKGLDLAKAYSQLPRKLGESITHGDYTIKWINDPQGGKHVEVYDKDKKFKASYDDVEKAKSAIDSGEVEGREDEAVETSTGSTFTNAGFTWKILDRKGDYTLVYAEKKKWHPYVVAWKLQSDGSWAQGHYFNDEDEARAYLKKKA